MVFCSSSRKIRLSIPFRSYRYSSLSVTFSSYLTFSLCFAKLCFIPHTSWYHPADVFFCLLFTVSFSRHTLALVFLLYVAFRLFSFWYSILFYHCFYALFTMSYFATFPRLDAIAFLQAMHYSARLYIDIQHSLQSHFRHLFNCLINLRWLAGIWHGTHTHTHARLFAFICCCRWWWHGIVCQGLRSNDIDYDKWTNNGRLRKRGHRADGITSK